MGTLQYSVHSSCLGDHCFLDILRRNRRHVSFYPRDQFRISSRWHHAQLCSRALIPCCIPDVILHRLCHIHRHLLGRWRAFYLSNDWLHGKTSFIHRNSSVPLLCCHSFVPGFYICTSLFTTLDKKSLLLATTFIRKWKIEETLPAEKLRVEAAIFY